MSKYRPLNTSEQVYIARFMESMAVVARVPTHPMREIARNCIAKAMWRWTADGVLTSTGVVKCDALKYDFSVHPATAAARRCQGVDRKRLRHEHVVPRDLLARRIIDKAMDAEQIMKLMRRFCRAAIVTVEEDQRLRPRNEMPLGWTWVSGNPYARYAYSKLGLHSPPAVA